MADGLDHLLVAGYTARHAFKSTLKVIPPPVPPRSRGAHGKNLLRQLRKLDQETKALQEKRKQLGLDDLTAVTVALEVSPRGSVDYFKQLEWKRDGIEVLSAHDSGGTEVVVLYVPEGKLSAFENRIKAYLDKDKDVQPKKPGASAKPKHAALVNAIAAFRKAAFAELWTDEAEPPLEAEATFFQVWLREGNHGARAARDAFAVSAAAVGITVEPGFVRFPGRIVVVVQATRQMLESALELLDQVAEIRSVAPTTEFYLSELKPFEQAQWVREMLGRTTSDATAQGPYVTLLDTGVNSAHPLLNPILNAGDQHAVEAAWGVSDHHGHGSQMAGLSIFGDLTRSLSSAAPISIPHKLETVKILPPQGANPPHLYGWVTAQAASKVEAIPDRLRTFAMMTTCEGSSTGLPSEWSATIDAMAFGRNVSWDGEAEPKTVQRLFTLASGNVSWVKWHDYPLVNYSTPIKDPGQAWNALTVGACTHMDEVDANKWPSHKPIASAGKLSPSSTTSERWGSAWPFKPDVVAEGGNGSMETGRPGAVVGPESLRLLTTAHDFHKSLLTESGDTSGATAEVARLIGHLQARYPGYWSETLRALTVHGATYTQAMRTEMPQQLVKQDKVRLLRRYGYGCINFRRTLTSASKRATLVLQETITPYEEDQKGSIKLGKLNMHALPWPSTVLQEFGEAMVNMKVTLSYFIEPNPSRRGWRSKFRYQSHGLRFAVQGSTESSERFMLRINKLTREELEEAQPDDLNAPAKQESITDPDVPNWSLGAQLRNRGSLHCDTWRGTASELAKKSHVAVFPVGGWWKDCGDKSVATRPTRYALVISLEVTSDVDIDIYTPIATAIDLGIQVPAAG